MSSPFLLPLRPGEAVALGELLFRLHPTPTRLAAHLPSLGLVHTKVFPHTLAPDPIHENSWYLLVADPAGIPWLLHLTTAAAPSSTLFSQPILLARAHGSSGQEIIANAIPVSGQLGTIILSLAPHLLARPSTRHHLWSVPAGPAWTQFCQSPHLPAGVLPAVRTHSPSWDPYLPLLLSSTPPAFVHILHNPPADLDPAHAAAFSRFSLSFNHLPDPASLAELLRHLRRLAPRSIDIELDLRACPAGTSEILNFCNNLHLLGAPVEGIAPPPHLSPADLSSPQLGLTLAADTPQNLSLPGPLHWQLSSFAN